MTIDLDKLGRELDEYTLCVQCGPIRYVDEDGCCSTCGGTAMGDGADYHKRTIASLLETLRIEREGIKVLNDEIAKRTTWESWNKFSAMEAEVEALKEKVLSFTGSGYEHGVNWLWVERDKGKLLADQLRTELKEAQAEHAALADAYSTAAGAIAELEADEKRHTDGFVAQFDGLMRWRKEHARAATWKRMAKHLYGKVDGLMLTYQDNIDMWNRVEAWKRAAIAMENYSFALALKLDNIQGQHKEAYDLIVAASDLDEPEGHDPAEPEDGE